MRTKQFILSVTTALRLAGLWVQHRGTLEVYPKP